MRLHLRAISLLTLVYLSGCEPSHQAEAQPDPISSPSIVVLGNVQDAGSPHIGCTRACCLALHTQPDPDRMVVSLGIIDPSTNQTWLIEATPDMPRQLQVLQQLAGTSAVLPNGIFLTHAHIGHYTGLMYLGREAIGADKVAVYAMPHMLDFLTTNGPWDQLVTLSNISLHPLTNEKEIMLSESIRITPLLVPHRDEYSETVGYKIKGPNRTVLFIPDINKWQLWERNIVEEIKKSDFVYIDATFYDQEEIGYRDIAEIPHPLVVESMSLFNSLPINEKNKIHFIHFNHTNPLLEPESKQTKEVLKKGFRIARFRDVFEL